MISLPGGQRALVYSVDEMDTLTPSRACLCFDILGPMGGEEPGRENLQDGNFYFRCSTQFFIM